MNWLMGLAVAPAIDRKILSAAKAPLGNHLSHFSVPASSLFEARTLKLVFFPTGLKTNFQYTEAPTVREFRVEIEGKFGGTRDLGL